MNDPNPGDSLVPGGPAGDDRRPPDAEEVAFEPERGPAADESRSEHPEGEDSGVSHTSKVLIGTGRSGIDAVSDLVPEASSAGVGPRFLDVVEDVAGGAQDSATESASGGGDDADEWHDVADATRDTAVSESVGFGAFLASPEAGDQSGVLDSHSGDSQGVAVNTAPTLDFQPSQPVSRSERRRSAPPSAGVGQVVGVILGGVLAIPVTLAILLWGFQRDPLGVATTFPEPLRFLLPRKVRGAQPSRALPGRRPAEGLDAIAAEASRLGSPTAPPSVASEEGLTIGASAADDTANDPDATLAGVPDDTPTPVAREVIAVEVPPVDIPPVDVAQPVTNLTALDAAVARALGATDTVDAAAGASDAAIVAWYRELAEAAREAAAAERRALEAGVPTSDVVDRIEPLARRLLSTHLGRIEELGAMWLSSVRRPSDGVVLAATVEESRPVGPWWGGRLAVLDAEPRSVAFLAAGSIRAEAGERVLLAGVLVDPSTMWAVAAWPVPGGADRRDAVLAPVSPPDVPPPDVAAPDSTLPGVPSPDAPPTDARSSDPPAAGGG